MNKKSEKEKFIEDVSTMLVYMCDPDIRNQWKTCEKYAEIIWDKFVKKLIK